MKKLNLARVLLWVITLAAFLGSQYYYHPDGSIFVVSLGILLALLFLVSWSISRIRPDGFSGAIKGLVVSSVAGFMAVQGMDVVYSTNFAPAGNRYIEIVETPVLAIAFFVPAYLNFRFGPKQQKDAQGSQGQ